MLRPISLELVLFLDLTFEHPSVLLFCFQDDYYGHLYGRLLQFSAKLGHCHGRRQRIHVMINKSPTILTMHLKQI